MSKRILLAITAIVVLTMVAVPFISHRSSSAVELTKVDPAFGAYVSAYTSGTISNESHIRVTLAEDYTGPVTLGEPVKESYFSFDPGITGKTYWLDTRTLEFRPEQRLPSNTDFQAEFHLDKILNDLPQGMQTMKFSFRTMRQDIDLTLEGMKTTDKTTLRKQQLLGTVITADAADEKIVEQLLTVTQGGQNLAIRWTHESDHVTHRFTVDNISRGDKESQVIVAWNGKPLGLESENSQTLSIPSLKDFKVTGVRVEQGQEQCVVLEFSDPLLEKQNLDGLITLKDGGALRYTIENNNIKVYPENNLHGDHAIRVTTGVKNILGFPLKNSFTQKLRFEELKPLVEFIGKGVILPNSGSGLFLPFKAVSLNAVDVKIVRIYENNIPQFMQVNELNGSRELYRVGKIIVKKKIPLTVKNKTDYARWSNYSLDLGELIKAEPGAIYRVSIGFRRDYAVYNCTDTTADENEEEYDSYRYRENEMEDEDDVEGYGYYGDYWEDDYYYSRNENEDPCQHSYYYGRTKSRNILASDLGLVAKRGNDGSLFLAVNDLHTTDPVSGVQLEVHDFQDQVLATVESDKNGFAKVNLPKKKPFLVVAKNGDQRGYLKLDDGVALSVAAFDVSGQMVQKGLKGMIYGERGVWRPGDTLFLGFILEDKTGLLPANHPVTMDLYNARGQKVNHIIRSKSLNGFYTYSIPTEADAPTGNWTVRFKVGGATFSKDLKVETIMPNRLKINIGFGDDKVLTAGEDQKLALEARWLHGSTAKNLKAKVEVSLYQSNTSFKGYENYEFDDPATRFSTDSKTAFDARLDENGRAEFDPQLSGQEAPGMLRASFNTRVFEEGGAFSSDRFSINYSPYNAYVGILAPKGSGWGGMLKTGTDYSVRVVTVDNLGKPLNKEKLTVKVYKVDWRWWFSEGHDNLSHYVSSDYYQPYLTKEISTKNGIGSFSMNVKEEDWGRYMIRVTDENGGHSTGTLVWFDWPYWDGSGTHTNDVASLLQFSSDKTKYNVGETMNLTIPSPGQGRALISLENGSKIIDAFWAETKEKGNITWSVPVTAEMAPNIYVHVTLVQPHGQVKNDAPIRLYGVVPITIDDPKTHLDPVLSTSSAVWQPEEQASVSVSEKNGKAMTYTVAVVDEGLLDLTRFQTPDPWNHFYAREALGVKTWDMYDLVMGAYGAEMSRVIGIGGDGEEGTKSGQKANRFKPVVKYFGPFELKPGEKKSHSFLMPQYVGSVRVMVVAGQGNAYGKTDKTVPVRKPLMILATLPRVVGPGETVDLPVDVFAMEKKIKNVSVTVTTNGLFTVEGGSTKTTTFKDIGDNIVVFRLKVADAIGLGKVKVVATSGSEKAIQEIELDVRPPNPEITDSYEAVIDPGESWTSDYTPVGILGTNKGVL
ncbi:MAG TPA: MG2 domain-containing protein, partial [Bacteroidia bacterium]|nr:MG2 domain-containing protein [Bacteroidia bacterium]